MLLCSDYTLNLFFNTNSQVKILNCTFWSKLNHCAPNWYAAHIFVNLPQLKEPRCVETAVSQIPRELITENLKNVVLHV